MRHIENPGMSEQLIRAYSDIRDIQQYSAMVGHIEGYLGIFIPEVYPEVNSLLRHVKQYSDIFRTLYNPCIYSRPIFRTAAHLEPEASSKSSRTCKMIRHIQSPSLVKRVFSSIFKDI